MRDAHHTKKTIRILIADAEGIFRLGLKKLFGVEDDLRVVAQADQAGQILGLAKKFKPDVFFLQSEMLGPDPADFLTRLRQVWAGGKIIVITSAVAGPESDRYIRGRGRRRAALQRSRALCEKRPAGDEERIVASQAARPIACPARQGRREGAAPPCRYAHATREIRH